MGKKGKREARREGWDSRRAPRARGGREPHEEELDENGQPYIYSFMNPRTKAMETFPFGLGGPCLRIQARHTSQAVLIAHFFYCCVTCGTLVSFGMGALSLMTTAAWLCHTLFTLATFFLHMVPDVGREAWLTFWVLPLVHGLHWAMLAHALLHGHSPSWLWSRWGESMGEHILVCQLGDTVLLLLPALATSVYACVESDFIALAFYDLHSQLLPEHRLLSRAFHSTSPLLVLAAWHFGCNARVLTDMPNIHPLSFALASALANFLMLSWHAYSGMHAFFGAVRWEGDGWNVWVKPPQTQFGRRGHRSG